MDSIVITLKNGQEQTDVALPISVPVGQLAPILFDKFSPSSVLINQDDTVFSARIVATGAVIHSHETLETVGVVDGEVLEIIQTPVHTRIMPGDTLERGRGAYLQSLDTDRKFRCIGRSTLVGRIRKHPINLANLPGSNNVSRTHANILKRGNSYIIKDEQSTNGTIVDGIELRAGESMQIRDGSRIQFGKDGPVLYFCAG